MQIDVFNTYCTCYRFTIFTGIQFQEHNVDITVFHVKNKKHPIYYGQLEAIQGLTKFNQIVNNLQDLTYDR